MTGTIPPAVKDLNQAVGSTSSEEAKNEQVLDTLKVERERGITVRAQSATMFHKHEADGHTYMLNLLDTPGHADFSSELLRSLLPSQGALLLVDAAQGVQAQTLSVLDEAMKRNLTVVGAGQSHLDRFPPSVIVFPTHHTFSRRSQQVGSSERRRSRRGGSTRAF